MTIYIFSTEHIYFYFIRHAKFGFLELESKENMSLRLPKKKKKKNMSLGIQYTEPHHKN